MRTLMALLLAATVQAQAAPPRETVDLDSPGALEALRVERPEHYAKTKEILALAQTSRGPKLGQLIEARYEASDVEMLQWRVSDPPKLRVSFTLERTRYTAQVVPNLPPMKLF